MSQQALDLRRSIQIVRRHKILVGAVVLAGILGGGAYTVVSPAEVASTALIALPQSSLSTEPAATTTTTGGADPYTATQEVIAGSYQVLVDALPNIHPAMSLDQLRHDISVGSPAPDIISITAKGKNAVSAESTANAVARSDIAYIGSPRSPVGHVLAQLLAPATSATGPAPIKRAIVFGLLGGLCGVLIGAIAALAIGRNSRRLRERDDIANSIGVPVYASFPVAHPANAGGWTRLLADYRPAAVYAFRLRQALQQLGAASVNGSGGSESGGSSFTVLSLSSDPGALALGPQLAVFAAAQGIPTTLVIGAQQDVKATATLRTACAVPPPASSKLTSRLRTAVVDSDADIQPVGTLTVVVAVVDAQNPQMPDTVRTAATVLGVSAGAATAEQLARVAMSASVGGRDIAGILVADPDPSDRTSGRVAQLPRSAHRRLPTRLMGMTTEIKR
jgi:capsular polysaccharide biosynthesis protein